MAIPVGFGGRDYPDFGVSGLQQSKISLFDMSELAVRLGSINRFDRSGVVIYQTGFEYGLGNWAQNSYDANSFSKLSVLYYSIVPYSMQLQTAYINDAYSGMALSLPLPYVSAMGFEFHVKFVNAIQQFTAQFLIYTGKYRYTVELRFDVAGNEITLYDAGQQRPPIFTNPIYYGGTSTFHVVKLVADLVNENYVRLVFDGVDTILSQHKIRRWGTDATPRLAVLFLNDPPVKAVDVVHLDNIIITMDEPT